MGKKSKEWECTCKIKEQRITLLEVCGFILSYLNLFLNLKN